MASRSPFPLTLILSVALFGLAAIGPGWAAGGGHKSTSGNGGRPTADHGAAAKEKRPSDPKSVELPVLLVPVVEGRRLVGYLYAGLMVMAEDTSGAQRLKDMMPLLQDAALRAFNEKPIAADIAETDAGRAAVIETLRKAAAGTPALAPIASIEIKEIQSAPF